MKYLSIIIILLLFSCASDYVYDFVEYKVSNIEETKTKTQYTLHNTEVTWTTLFYSKNRLPIKVGDKVKIKLYKVEE